MEVLHARCAGLDVHKDTVIAAVRLAGDGPVKSEVRTFGTTTPGLLTLSAWLAENACTHVVMEVTGVYWKPAWLADLLAHGLIRARFVPEAPTQELRALLRTRKQLVREQASHVQRIQKTPEDANLRLSSVLTQIMGKSGRAILDALVGGERNPDALLALVRRASRRRPRSCVLRCRAVSPTVTVLCCACTCASSTRLMPPWPRSTRRWTATSTLSARRSACCGRSRA